MMRFCLTMLALLSMASAQTGAQPAVISGIVSLQDQGQSNLPENLRVGLTIVDAQGYPVNEVVSVTPVGGTFSIGTREPNSQFLRPWTGDMVLLPGFQEGYSLEPSDASIIVTSLFSYLDDNGNGSFFNDDDTFDRSYIGISSLKRDANTVSNNGFYRVVYVNKPVTLRSQRFTLQLAQGWNVITSRPSSESRQVVYAATRTVDDVFLDLLFMVGDNPNP